MDENGYWTKPLTLNELLHEIEHLDDPELVPDGIIVFPPDDGKDTDEDSGDENEIDINNLPGSQLSRQAEVVFDNKQLQEESSGIAEEDYDSEDDVPLSLLLPRPEQHPLQPKLKKRKKEYSWKKQDINPKFPDWTPETGPQNSLTPLELFSLFIDDEVIDLITQYTNLYAFQHNRPGDIHQNEIRYFIGVLLLSGYNFFPRRSMYWENSEDAGCKLVYSAIFILFYFLVILDKHESK